MVVTDFDIISVTIFKQKTDSPLVVDRNRISAVTVAFERVQPIAWWNFEVAENGRRTNLFKLAKGPPRYVLR
jgi:hypothetical protein